jgi:predicted metal-dependent peptidase
MIDLESVGIMREKNMTDYLKSVIDSALKTLKAGIINLMDTEPFFAQVLMSMEYVPAPIGTCAVDGKRFFYEPEFLATRTINDRKFIIAHEALHQALFHPFQMRDALKANPKFDLELANIAMDYVINAILKSTGWRLPNDALYERRFTPEMEWIQVYRILENERQQNPSESHNGDTSSRDNDSNSSPSRVQNEQQSSTQNGDGSSDDTQAQSGNVSNGESRRDSGEDTGDENGKQSDKDIPSECKEHPNGGVIPAKEDQNEEAKAKQNISQASEIAQRAGTIPSTLQRKLEDVFDIVASPWEVLQDHISRETVGDKTYRRSSRRSIDPDFMLPSFEKDFEIENGVFAFDVSGSVNQEMMNHFWKHGTNIISEYSGTVFAVFCDSKLPKENVFEFECNCIPETLPSFKGGGGTKFKPVFNWIEENDIEPDFLVYFTDMETSDWKKIQEPSYPVFWLVWNSSWKKEDTSFGETIDISREKY